MTSKVVSFYPIFTDLDGSPLDSGYIYIGEEGLNPEIDANQINVYWDESLTVPAAQPIRTINGYPSISGSPAAMYVAEAVFSITTRNKKNELISSELSETSTSSSLRADLSNTSSTTLGSFLVGVFLSATGYVGRTLSSWIADRPYYATDFGVTFDGVTDDTVNLQKFIDALELSNKKGEMPEGTALFTTLTIDAQITLAGAGAGTILKTTLTSGNAIHVDTVNNGLFEDFKIEGASNSNIVSPTQTTVGLLVDTSTRNIFRNIRFSKLHTPIKTESAWSNHFDTCLASQCYWGLVLGSATNNTLFTSFWAANCWLMLDVTTSEGVQFNSPLWQNCGATSGEGSGIQIFQSGVTMVNPYFENTSIDSAVTVGSGAESILARSSLNILGGEFNEGTGSNVIVVGGAGVHISVDGIKASAAGLHLGSPGSPAVITSIKTLESDSVWRPYNDEGERLPALIAAMLPNNNEIFPKGGGGGGALTQIPRREGYRQIQTSSAFRGPILTSNLVIGQRYTVVYSMRAASGNALSFTCGFSLGLPSVPLPTDDFKMQYLHFKATATALTLLIGTITSDVDIKYWAVYDGTVIPQIEITQQPQVWGVAAPTAGSWLQGDVVHNQSAVVGQPVGWKCSVAGTPGTWVALANL